MLIHVSASATHNAANVRETPDEMIELIAQTGATRDTAGSKTLIEVGICTAFGRTIQGDVPVAEVFRLFQAALDAGAERVALADTIGYADPGHVRRLLTKAFRALGSDSCRLASGHFHPTRGLARANTLAAQDVGVSRLDASLAGIGGCPHAPGASGSATNATNASRGNNASTNSLIKHVR